MSTNESDSNKPESFKDLFGKVQPLKQDKHKHYNPKLNSRPRPLSQYEKEPKLPFVSQMHKDAIHLLGANDKISYNANGISHRIIKQLGQGSIAIEANCDLHGMNIDEADAHLARFINSCRHKKLRCIRVVHGKSGHHAKIKSWCAEALRLHEDVLAIASCIPRHGGTGAIYVLLKTR